MTLDEAKRTKAAFFVELEALCRKHDVSLGHEDGQGAFQLLEFDESNIAWVKAASDQRVTCSTCGGVGRDYAADGTCLTCGGYR